MVHHPFLDRFLEYIHRHKLIRRGDQVLAGVSGGADSVALLHALYSLRDELGISALSILHFNHCLRGRASDLDEAFVRSLSEQLQLAFTSRRVDVSATAVQEGVSIEMAARACRHRFFRDHLTRLEQGKLALAHTANDQAEEVLLRIFRGTGPSGSAGMAPHTPEGIIRPLLFAQRREILDYLDSQEIDFRQDASNLEPFCQRNALRLKVFPLIEEIFHGRIIEVLNRHADLVREEEIFWDSTMRDSWKDVCLEESSSRMVLKAPALAGLPVALRRRTIRYALGRLQGDLSGFYATHVEAIDRLARRSTSGRAIHLPRGFRAAREGESLILSTAEVERKENSSASPCSEDMVIECPGLYPCKGFNLQLWIEQHNAGVTRPVYVPAQERVLMDAGKIAWPLTVRTWEPGDRFHPLGSPGTKKLQDFFTDTKVPRRLRSQVPLLCDREKICWVMGFRLDERVKVSRDTRQLLIVEKQPSESPPTGVPSA